LFKQTVSKLLDLLPDIEGAGAKDVAARDVVVLNQICFGDYLRVPQAEIGLFWELNTALVDVSRALCFRRLLLLLFFLLRLLSGDRRSKCSEI